MSAALAPLYVIESELAELLDCIDTCSEELQPELQARIASYTAQSLEKVDHIAHVLASLEYEQKAAGDEITRLQERKKHAKAAQDKLEAYVCRVIQARGKKALEGKTNTLSTRPSDGVVITDERFVPLAFQTVTIKIDRAFWISLLCQIPEETIDRMLDLEALGIMRQSVEARPADIKRVLKAGGEVPGADLEFRMNLVRR